MQPRASHRPRRAVRWLPWLAGAAAVAAVVMAATHFAEERAFARVAEEASPWWLLVALAPQIGTYLAQGEIWRDVARAGKSRLPFPTAWRLSLAKLFVDQALPAGGLTGAAVLIRALEARGIPRPIVMAAIVVTTISFYTANVAALLIALVLAACTDHVSAVVLATSAVFVALGIALTAVLLALASGQRTPRLERASRLPLVGRAVALVRIADPEVARSPRLSVRAGLWQLAIILLDAATLWLLIRALGHAAPPAGVFASFMIATVARILSPIPGGLGVFEATSVVTLDMVGIPLATSLSATLLFRGVTFWLPMAPGLVMMRHLRGDRRKA